MKPWEMNWDEIAPTENPWEMDWGDQNISAPASNYEFSDEDLKRVQENTKNVRSKQSSNMSGVGIDALKGVGLGGLLAIEKMANGLSAGGYGWLSRQGDGAYQKRDQELQDYANNAPYAGMPMKLSKFGTEAGSNIIGPGSLLLKGLGKTGIAGKKLYGLSGAIEGAAYGATGSDSLSELPGNIVKGAGFGGALGAVAPAITNQAAKVIGKGANTLSNTFRRATGKGQSIPTEQTLRKIRDAVGQDAFDSMMKESQKTGRSLVEVADERVLPLLSEAIANSNSGRIVLSKTAKELSESAGSRSRNIIDDIMGNKTRNQNLASIERKYAGQAKPLYNELNKTGVVEEANEAIFGNANLRQAIEKVKTSFPELRKLQSNDFRVLNEARKALSAEMMEGGAKGYYARAAVGQLDDALANSSIGANYSKARGLYSEGYKLKGAQDLGYDFLNAKTLPNDFKTSVSKMTKPEKEALSIGMRERLIDTIGNAENETLQLKKILPQNAQMKIKDALGKEKGNSLVNFAEAEIKRMRNLNEVLKQSRTAEFQRMQRNPIVGLLDRYGNRNKVGAIGQAGRDISGLLRKGTLESRYGRIAEAMADQNIQQLQNASKRAINMPSDRISGFARKMGGQSALLGGLLADELRNDN